jgi:hypothetical protein
MHEHFAVTDFRECPVVADRWSGQAKLGLELSCLGWSASRRKYDLNPSGPCGANRVAIGRANGKHTRLDERSIEVQRDRANSH